MPAPIEVTFEGYEGYLSLPFKEFAHVMHSSFEESLTRNGAGLVRRVMGITPPGNNPGTDGALTLEDRRRGESAIQRDLYAIFTPVKIKGLRAERYSYEDAVAIHLRHLIDKRPGAPMRSDLGRAYYHVRDAYVKQLFTELASHVGRMAAGWLPAAQALNVSPPAWVARHSGSGSYALLRDGGDLTIIATNSAIYPFLMAEMQRRVPYAMRYQADAMMREMDFFAEKELRALGGRLRAVLSA